MKKDLNKQEEHLVEQFHIEELEQRLEMKFDWSSPGPVISIGPTGTTGYPLYP